MLRSPGVAAVGGLRAQHAAPLRGKSGGHKKPPEKFTIMLLE